MQIRFVLLVVVTLLVFAGCSREVECIECRKGDDFRDQCSDEVSGWDADFLMEYWKERGYACTKTN